MNEQQIQVPPPEEAPQGSRQTIVPLGEGPKRVVVEYDDDTIVVYRDLQEFGPPGALMHLHVDQHCMALFGVREDGDGIARLHHIYLDGGRKRSVLTISVE